MRKVIHMVGLVVASLLFGGMQAWAETVTLSGASQMEDTYLRGDDSQNSAVGNFGGSTLLIVGEIPTDVVFNALMRFTDFSGVSGQTVTNATLRLYNTNHANQTGDVDIEIHELVAANGDWVEGNGTGGIVNGVSDWRFKIQNTGAWAGGRNGAGVAGTDYTTHLVGSATAADTTAEWVEFTLDASVVQNWIDNPGQNYGIVLTAPGAADGETALFRSSETTATTTAPQLVLEVVPKTTEMVYLGGTNQLEDVYLRGDNSQISAPSNYGASTLLIVGQLNSDVVVNSLMRVTDLSTVSGRTVTNATLRLYNQNHANQTGDVTIDVYEVAAANGDWVEGDGLGTVITGTSDWRFKIQNTGEWAGGRNGCGVAETDYITNLVGRALFADTAAEWVEITLDASVVQNWIDNPGQNYGLLLTAPGAAVGQIAYLDSSEASTGTDPVLALEVLLEKTYAQWAEANSLTGTNALKAADVEPDGMDNLLEYALGGDPNVDDASEKLPVSGMVEDSGTNWLEYVYNRRLDAAERNLDYGIILNTDLVSGTWSNIGTSAETGSAAVDADFETVTNQISTVESEKFINLEVIEN